MLRNVVIQSVLVGSSLLACAADLEDIAQVREDFTGQSFAFQTVTGIGKEAGFTRRDPSDVIKVGDTYFVYYTHVDHGKLTPERQRLRASGYVGVIWYATSKDEGHNWTEQGLALGTGPEGAFDSYAVFTPNIVKFNGQYWLYYTGVKATPGKTLFENNSVNDVTALGVAVADSPHGPFKRLSPEPILRVTPRSVDPVRPSPFDSFRIDDAALLVRDHDGDGDLDLWLYYKGRNIDHGRSGPGKTEMGLAIADTPAGPYTRVNQDKSILPKSHEVMIWPQRKGVAAYASASRTLEFAADGVDFTSHPLHISTTNKPIAPGCFRADLVTPAPFGPGISWGICMRDPGGPSPYLLRYAIDLARPARQGISVWAAGSTEKIQNRRRAEQRHDQVWDADTQSVTLTGVRGEWLPFHLVLSVTERPATNVRLEISDLRQGDDVLAAAHIRPYLEHLVTVYAATGLHGRRGRWPDPLVPLTRPFSVAAVDNQDPRHQPLWIDIHVRRDQRPGTYQGSLAVHADQGLLGKVKIALTVVDVTLPAQRRFPAHVGFYEHHIARMYGLEPSSPAFQEIFKHYLKFFLNNRLDPRTPPAMHGRIENGKYVLSWPRPELEQLFLEHGRVQFLISPVPQGIPGPGREEPFTVEYEGYVHQHVAQVIAHARQNGWYERLVFWMPIDEPKSLVQYEAVRRWADAIRAVDPDVRVSVTEQPKTENPAWGSLVGHVNAWTVNGNYLFHEAEAIDARKRAGEFITWYISCDQLYPQPNYYIDREAADLRMVPWITWRYKLDGILYWNSSFWEEILNPWIDPISWKWFPCNSPAAGEGSLIYPGNMAERYARQDNVIGPVGSLRLALLREGLEELELLGLLAELGGEAVADEIAASVCRNVRDFSRDPQAIDFARTRVIEEILKAKQR